jgi:hypothetical protein
VGEGVREVDDDLIKVMAELGAESGHCFVATAGSDGFPHLESAPRLHSLSERGRVSLRAWFTHRTVENLSSNPRISVSVWDARAEQGVQALGAVEAVEERAFFGLLEPGGGAEALPSVELELRVRLDSIHAFRRAPRLSSFRLESSQASRAAAGLVVTGGGVASLTELVRPTYPC